MINREQIKEVLPVFLEMKESDDIEISEVLKAQGLKLEDAERVSAFFPSAFCRIALSHTFNLGFSDTYCIEGKEGEFSFQEEPIYKLGIEMASEIYHNEPQLAEVFNCIVARSSEFNTVNNALNAGADIEGANFSPTNYSGYKTLGNKCGLFSQVVS
ncbi:hypothetical protein [Vibrio coralliilyticus]|uniref:hypothetical protein n=1 Tax=Vibrio coralliilyticus TaxID=190893 RepID=UPI0006CD8A60|nr:hypothetical protein [Vibrio coralliilyticus]AXN34771.1 hypothetical protein DVV14_26145 [Vibrio coralliilyticus]KPH25038.1 hypothetical protein ADU60_16255 [Vibrio coralliilyticus]